MKRTYFNYRTFWVTSFIVTTLHSMSAFSAPDRGARASGTSARITNSSIVKVLEKDCITCTPQVAPGGPLDGNRTVTDLAMVSNKALSQEEQVFRSNQNIFCMTIPELRTEKDFNRKLMEPMSKTGTITEKFWMDPGCEPRYIAKTFSPLMHLISENSTDRMKYVLYLQKFYAKDPATFKKILNSKNTQGHTVLDYIQYSHASQRFASVEESGLNAFVKYLCDNGAEYSVYEKTKKCPAEYMTINY